jgi:citronellol/citronellal dehydrogenase
MTEPGRHHGRVAIITGASRGIGKDVALRLAREGAKVVVAAKSDVEGPKLTGTIHDTVREIEEAGGEAMAVRVDVREEAQIEAMIARTIERFGKLDILFNNAGAIYLASVADTPTKRFDLMWQVNVRAAFLTAHHALPHMVANGWGHILNFSPPLHDGPSAGMAPYMTTKFGMTRLAISIAEEHATDNIAANAIWPVTMIDTAAVRNNHLGTPEQWRTSEIVCDAVSELFAREPRTCTGRALTDEEILREAGVTDFDHYWVLGSPPEHPMLIVGEGSIMR